MINYRNFFKLIYAILFLNVVLVVGLLWYKQALTGQYGQYTALALVFVFFIYGFINLRRLLEEEKRVSNNLKNEEVKDWSAYYNRIVDSRNKLSFLRHDLANHMHIFDSLQNKYGIEVGAREIIEIKKYLDETSYVKYCDNILLDIALRGKIAWLNEKGITVCADVLLNGMQNYECEKLCEVVFENIDVVCKKLTKKESLYIKISKGEKTKNGVLIKWSVATEKGFTKVGIMEAVKNV